MSEGMFLLMKGIKRQNVKNWTNYRDIYQKDSYLRMSRSYMYIRKIPRFADIDIEAIEIR